MKDNAITLRKTDLSDKYDLSETRIFATGTQTLVRMCLAQSALDPRYPVT